MKKVLFVIPYMYEGGAERALSNIEIHFPKDWEIHTLVNSEYNKKYPHKGRLFSLEINKKPNTRSVFFQFYVFLKRTAKLKQLKKKNHYDACISFLDSANIANIISGNKYCKTIISVRANLNGEKRVPQYRFIVNPLAKLLYNRADKIVAVSEELKNGLVEGFGLLDSKVHVISNGHNVENISKLKEESLEEKIAKTIKGRKVVCNVGRLSFPKGQWHLIRAFRVVKERVPNAVLLIVGEGEYEKYLEEIIEELGLTESVLLLGHKDNVYKYINNADVFAFTSLLEGFPNALAEAICVGVPCVVTDFKTGSREIIAPELLNNNEPINKKTECEYGVLVPECSGTKYKGDDILEKQEQILADAIIEMINNESMANHYKEKCLERRKTLDINDSVKKWIEVIEE